MDFSSFITEHGKSISVIGLLVAAFIGGYKRIWTWGYQHDDLVKRLEAKDKELAEAKKELADYRDYFERATKSMIEFVVMRQQEDSPQQHSFPPPQLAKRKRDNE